MRTLVAVVAIAIISLAHADAQRQWRSTPVAGLEYDEWVSNKCSASGQFHFWQFRNTVTRIVAFEATIEHTDTRGRRQYQSATHFLGAGDLRYPAPGKWVCAKPGTFRLIIEALPDPDTDPTYACPLAGPPRVRQGDAVAKTGGRFNSNRPKGPHGALDLDSTVGEPVLAARSGRVAIASPSWGQMGGTVIIDHGDGDYTVYGHLGAISVKTGYVMKGTKVGEVGYTGNAKDLKKAKLPPHLHFALIKAGQTNLADRGGPLGAMKKWADYWEQTFSSEHLLVGPVNPGLFFPAGCWTGSTTMGAPGER